MRNDPEVTAYRYSLGKAFLAGMATMGLLMALGIGLRAGKLAGVGDRLGRVAEAFTEDPTTTSVPVDTTPAVTP